MFFNNPIERLRSEAGKLVDLPQTLSRLQAQGSLSELASLIYSVYRHEYDSVFHHLKGELSSSKMWKLDCVLS